MGVKPERNFKSKLALHYEFLHLLNLILDLSNLIKTRMMRKVDLERAAASQLTRSADSFNLKSWLEIHRYLTCQSRDKISPN